MAQETTVRCHNMAQWHALLRLGRHTGWWASDDRYLRRIVVRNADIEQIHSHGVLYGIVVRRGVGMTRLEARRIAAGLVGCAITPVDSDIHTVATTTVVTRRDGRLVSVARADNL